MSGFMRQAPSSRLYSVWRWRFTNSFAFIICPALPNVICYLGEPLEAVIHSRTAYRRLKCVANLTQAHIEVVKSQLCNIAQFLRNIIKSKRAVNKFYIFKLFHRGIYDLIYIRGVAVGYAIGFVAHVLVYLDIHEVKRTLLCSDKGKRILYGLAALNIDYMLSPAERSFCVYAYIPEQNFKF